MKYALISDIHGNKYALEAVLNDAKTKDVDKYIFLGDYFMSIPYANETIEILQNQEDAYFIKGNEEDHLNYDFDDDSWTDNGQFSAVYHTNHQLTDKTKVFLNDLPKSFTLKDEFFEIFMFHSPNDFFEETYLHQVTPLNIATQKAENPNVLESVKMRLLHDNKLQETVKNLPKGIYAFGHNHIQMNIEIGESLLINPGSCGLPLDFSNGASYSILETSKDGWKVTEHKLDYDLDTLVQEIKESTLYAKAPVWYNLIIKELEKSASVVTRFLAFMEKYAWSIGDAKRPYTHKTWEEGFLAWSDID